MYQRRQGTWRNSTAGIKSVGMARVAEGDLVQETQLNCSHSPTVMCWQVCTGVNCTNVSLWCGNQRQQEVERERDLATL